jgi:hypothetical protein
MRYLSTLIVCTLLAACQNSQTSTTNQNNSTSTATNTPAAPAAPVAIDSPKNVAPPPPVLPKPTATPKSLAAQTVTTDTVKPKKSPKHILEGKYDFGGFDTGMAAGYLIDNVHMEIVGDRVSGSAGCNNYFGNCTLSKKRSVTFTKIGGTKKMCDEELMATEDHLLRLLGKTTRYEINADRVSFFEGDEPLFTFKKVR